jgi:hypothetical protein
MDSIQKILQETKGDTKLASPIIQRTWFEYFQTKNFVIILLLTVVILLFLGINILTLLGTLIQSIIYALKPLISSILLLFGVSINTIGDLFDSIGDIIDSFLHFFGNGIQSISKYSYNGGGGNYSGGGGNYSDGDEENDNSSDDGNEDEGYTSNDTNNNIQQPNMVQNKQTWCLIGDTPGSRTCIPVPDSTKCMSGMTYTDEQTCINPTTTANNPMTQTTSSKYYPNAGKDTTPFANGGMGGTAPTAPYTSVPDGSMASKTANISDVKTTGADIGVKARAFVDSFMSAYMNANNDKMPPNAKAYGAGVGPIY